jgi:hypothetical protein
MHHAVVDRLAMVSVLTLQNVARHSAGAALPTSIVLPWARALKKLNQILMQHAVVDRWAMVCVLVRETVARHLAGAVLPPIIVELK